MIYIHTLHKYIVVYICKDSMQNDQSKVSNVPSSLLFFRELAYLLVTYSAQGFEFHNKLCSSLYFIV